MEVYDSSTKGMKFRNLSMTLACQGKISTAGGKYWCYLDNIVSGDPDEEWQAVTVNGQDCEVSSLGLLRNKTGYITRGHESFYLYGYIRGRSFMRIVAEAFCMLNQMLIRGTLEVDHI